MTKSGGLSAYFVGVMCIVLHFAYSYVGSGRIAVYISILEFLHNKSGSLRCRRYTLVGSSLHLELVHGFTSLGNVDLVVALHISSLLLGFRKASRFPIGERLFLSVALFCPMNISI